MMAASLGVSLVQSEDDRGKSRKFVMAQLAACINVSSAE
jgi:hypothetical protein